MTVAPPMSTPTNDAAEWFSATFLRLSDGHSLVTVEEIVAGVVRGRPEFEEALFVIGSRAK